MKKFSLNLEKYTKFQNDKEVVLAAVQQNGYALYYASKELKDNKEVLLTAVQNKKENKEQLNYLSK